MTISKYLYVSQMLLISIVLSACGSSSSDSGPTMSDVGIRFSDAPVEDLASVVITVDKLTFRRSNGDNIVVDTFTSEELNLIDSDTFQLNLLELQGLTSSLVLDSVTLPVGEYQNLIIEVLDDQSTETYVQETVEGVHKELMVPSNELKLGRFTVSATSSQTFVVEFGLRHAMTHNPGPDRYILKPRGVRIVRLADASNISGTVDVSTVSCVPSDDTSISHVAYLYEDHGLDAELLGDVFDREIDTDVPENIIAPAVATSIDGVTGYYLFPYLNDGDYTVAISCNAIEDNAADYDEITIPSPAGHLVELTLATETNMTCDFVEGFDATCEENTSPLE